jgi:hypothetical protein
MLLLAVSRVDLLVPLSLLLMQNCFSVLLLSSASSKHAPVISVFVCETQLLACLFCSVLGPDPRSGEVSGASVQSSH